MPAYCFILNAFKLKQQTPILHAKISMLFLWNFISRCETL